MFKSFILWLVTKYLTPRDRLQLVVNDGFVDDPRLTIDRLYHLGHSSTKSGQLVPFNNVAAKAMASHDVSGNMFIITLFALKQRLFYCGSADCEEAGYLEFFNKVQAIKSHTNPLKVRKDLTELVRKETTFINENDITLVANVLQHSFINPVTVKLFIAGDSK